MSSYSHMNRTVNKDNLTSFLQTDMSVLRQNVIDRSIRKSLSIKMKGFGQPIHQT